MFWTVPLAPDSVEVHPGEGSASYHVKNIATLDFGDIVNDLLHGSAVPATASWAAEWHGVRERVKIRDTKNGFAAQLAYNSATLAWSATVAAKNHAGFGPLTFVSDPASTSHSLFAAVGHERNGQFFPQGG